MTLNGPECSNQLKVRFPDSMPDVRMLCLSEPTMRDWMNIGLNYQRQKCGQWTAVSEHMRFVRFFVGIYGWQATNRSGAAKIDNFSLNAASFVRYLEMFSILHDYLVSLADALFHCGSRASCFFRWINFFLRGFYTVHVNVFSGQSLNDLAGRAYTAH